MVYFRLCKWLYWKHRALVPLSISVASSIIVSIITTLVTIYL